MMKTSNEVNMTVLMEQLTQALQRQFNMQESSHAYEQFKSVNVYMIPQYKSMEDFYTDVMRENNNLAGVFDFIFIYGLEVELTLSFLEVDASVLKSIVAQGFEKFFSLKPSAIIPQDTSEALMYQSSVVSKFFDEENWTFYVFLIVFLLPRITPPIQTVKPKELKK